MFYIIKAVGNNIKMGKGKAIEMSEKKMKIFKNGAFEKNIKLSGTLYSPACFRTGLQG